MKPIFQFFLRFPFIGWLLTAIIFVGGIVTAPFDLAPEWLPTDPVPVDAIPDLGENQQIVYAEWPGRSPRDVEDQITYPLTQALLGSPGVEEVRSHSAFGLSSVYLIFEEGRDFYWCRSRILEKLSTLPDGLLPVSVHPRLGPDATALGQVFWYHLEGLDPKDRPVGGWSLEEMRTIQDFYIKNSLLAVKGVAEVASVGGFRKEYKITLNPAALRYYKLTPSDVERVLERNNLEAGAGTMEVNRAEYYVRGTGYVKNTEDLEAITVAVREEVPVRLGEVARIYYGPAPRRGVLDRNGQETVGGVVVAQEGANTADVIRRVRDRITELAPGLPEKVLTDGTRSRLAVRPFYDRSQVIEANLQTLGRALGLALLVMVIVILAMMRSIRVSLISGAVVSLAILLTFLFMWLWRVEANLLAMIGIAIAIGTMVDMAVILTESILRRREEADGASAGPGEVLAAVSEVLPAVVTATATTVLCFLPVFALQEVEGRMFIPLALTKTFALTAALLISFIFVPTVAVLLLNRWESRKEVRFPGLNRLHFSGFPFSYLSVILFALLLLTWLWQPLPTIPLLVNFLFVSGLILLVLGPILIFYQRYPAILQWCLLHKALFLTIPLLLTGAGVLIWSQLGRTFLPNLDEGQFLVMPSSVAGAGLEENRELLQMLDGALARLPEVDYVVGKLGRAESALDPAPISMFESLVSYKPEYGRDSTGRRVRQWRSHIHTPDDIWEEIRAVVAQLPGLTVPPRLQPMETRLVMLQTGMRAPLGLRLKGNRLEDLDAFGRQLEEELRKVSGIRPATVFYERNTCRPYLTVHIDRLRAGQFGLDVQTVQRSLQMGIDGVVVSRTVEGRESFALRLQFPRDYRQDPESLGRLPLSLPGGDQIPLATVARIDFEVGPEKIRSEDGFLVQYLTFDKEENQHAAALIEWIDKHLKEKMESGVLNVPAGVHYEAAGTFEDQQRASSRLRLVLALAIGLILGILYLQFRSIVLSLMVFSGIIVAFAGGFGLLWLYGQEWFMAVGPDGSGLRELFSVQEIPLSVAVWVGFLALFGIASDDGVLMATSLQQRFAKQRPEEAGALYGLVLEAGKRRLRPALITTATTLLALLPVLTAPGQGSELIVPMTVPLFGGMLVQMLTILMVPVLFASWQEHKMKNNEKN